MIAPLTGVRAFAALWVVFFHLRIGPARTLALPDWFAWFCQIGYLGVDLFGVLSGFVITHNYVERLARLDPATTGRFLWIRAVRIVPLHWFALAVLVAARLAPGGFDPAYPHLYAPRDLVEQIFLVHGFGFGQQAWNLPSWTVSSEWLCYLLFPLLAAPLRAVLGGRAALLAALALLATIVAMRWSGHPTFNVAAGFGVVRIFGEFLTGCLLQRAYTAGFGRAWSWNAIGPLAIGAVVLFAWLWAPAAIVVCLAVLVYALAQEQGWLARLLSTGPVLFLGEASYAIYIVHYVVLRMFVNWLPGSGPDDPKLALRVAVQFATVLGVAIAAHLAIENPARRRLRHWVAPV